jgi:serine/threonine protein phosphatase 1
MIADPFNKARTTREKRAGPRGAAGKRCYAVGDVHGRLDLLETLFTQIAEHDAARPRRETTVVMLGDLIDRGPNSREVIERLMRPLPFPGRLICLKGNHEEMLGRGLGGEPQLLARWLEYGGRECARSYGLDVTLPITQSMEVLEHNLRSAIPDRHIRFLNSLPDTARFGDYLLVHAGVRPGTPLQDQLPGDLRWIRDGFLESGADHGFVVIHGHSIALRVEERVNRIGIDTGAYMTGILTAVWLEDSERGFIQAVGEATASFS